ncbi:polysaccharide deacetylase family protein [Marinobacter lacisalsi]|uniref:Polysaccharide deacetylase family protein n=1 Tax=Marinobacter lacisalsi TaxID=475979 RepID=A0ABV8QNH9_9GAMM
MNAVADGLEALISIHDVMPETRQQVQALLDRLPPAVPTGSVLLLVVPGQDWSPGDRAWLASLQRQGYPLAGHGWCHQCASPRTVYHRLHSALLSRDAAEHLSLDAGAIARLIRANYQWFEQHGLEPPELYVPPAWALGSIERETLPTLPFRFYETLTGIYDADRDDFCRLPVIGFEADTTVRARLLRSINNVQLCLARWQRQPVRIAIHPHDAELYLARDLQAALASVRNPLPLSSSCRDGAGRALFAEGLSASGSVRSIRHARKQSWSLPE